MGICGADFLEAPDEPHHWMNARYIHDRWRLPPFTKWFVEGGQAPLYYLLVAPLAVKWPVVGDWNGDGTAKLGVYRDGQWVLDYAGTCDPHDLSLRKFHFGLKTDIPVVSNWGHAGRADHAGVVRDGLWYVDVNGDGKYDPKDDGLYPFGLPGDIPVVNWVRARRSAYIVVDCGSWTETGTTATMRTTWYSRTGAREISR